MYEVRYLVKDAGFEYEDRKLVAADSKVMAISIVRMHNDWDGLVTKKYVAKKWM